MSSSTTTTLVLGATGNTGRRLVEQLLADGQSVRAIVRSKERFHAIIPEHEQLKVFQSTTLDMEESEFVEAVSGCDAVVSCLGHNLTFKGVYAKPRNLVAGSLKRACDTVKQLQPERPVKIILMGSNGVANPDGTDRVRPWKERTVISMLRWTLPPHIDNEKAAAYLSREVKDTLQWVVVRPDNLIEGDVSEYELLDRPSEAGLFGGGQTTRANVAHFMKELITKDDVWEEWLFKMPVPTNIPKDTSGKNVCKESTEKDVSKDLSDKNAANYSSAEHGGNVEDAKVHLAS